MKAFDELRAKAKTRRDLAVKQARDEYTQTVQDIAGLEMRLAPLPPVERPRTNRTKPLIDVIVDCLPRDREFDVDSLFGWINEADPDRKPSKATVRTNVHRLLRQGVLKRVQRADGTRKALFAVAALEVEREPTLREWVERFAGETSEPDELLVEMLDAGYQPDSNLQDALKAVRANLANGKIR
jgi:hypothetical protein